MQSGNKVIASLAPAFIANYDGAGITALKEALLKLGFADAEETAIGATIVKRQYDKLIADKTRDIVISSCCHSINLLIQKYFPELLGHLADIMSPMQAHSLDIKRRHPGAKTVFIGPCLAKKDEAEYYEGIVDAVLTFEELSQWLNEEKISINLHKDDTPESRARFFPTTGGILKTMSCDQADVSYLSIDGVSNCVAALKDIQNGNIHRCFIEMSACAGSCIGGPVMEKNHRSPVRDYMQVKNYAGQKDFQVNDLEPEQIKKGMIPIPKKMADPPEQEIAAILRQMGKITKADELNCGSCGYNTCRQKAIAVSQGKAVITMCMPFLTEKSESFADMIINNNPNCIIVLNDAFEVQQINDAALKLMNIRNKTDVLGEQVVRILDPADFISVLQTGKSIENKRVYLAEYKKYVYESINYDKNYNILVCNMRDITQEENERSKKESIRKQTIDITDKVVDRQLLVVQEIASLLGETAAETKIALTKLKESIKDE